MKNKKVIAAVFLVALVGGIGAVVAAFTMPSTSNSNPIESTVEIGARWDPYVKDGWLTPATFQPSMSADKAIARAKAELKKRLYYDADKLNLPVRTTVGLFTGQPEDGGAWVIDLKARVVVFDDIPDTPIQPPGSPPYTGMTRVTTVLDDATGKFVYGTIMGAPK